MILREQLEYSATAAVINFSRILPERAVYALFRSFAMLLYVFSGRRRKLALRNTGIAFPDMPPNGRRALVRNSFLNLSESMAVHLLILTNRISNERLLNMVEMDNWEKLEPAGENPEGRLVISGHMGNWELLSLYTTLRLKKQIHIISRKGNNRLLEERLVRPHRERFGVSVFYKKNALMRMVKAIRRGDYCGMLIDQKLHPPEGIRVNFFGEPAPTSGSAALLQIRFGVPVQSIFMVKEKPGKYRMIIGDLIPWTDNGKPLEEQVLELAGIHQKIIEDMVRRYPDQWFWMHNRWGLQKVK